MNFFKAISALSCVLLANAMQVSAFTQSCPSSSMLFGVNPSSLKMSAVAEEATTSSADGSTVENIRYVHSWSFHYSEQIEDFIKMGDVTREIAEKNLR